MKIKVVLVQLLILSLLMPMAVHAQSDDFDYGVKSLPEGMVELRARGEGTCFLMYGFEEESIDRTVVEERAFERADCRDYTVELDPANLRVVLGETINDDPQQVLYLWLIHQVGDAEPTAYDITGDVLLHDAWGRIITETQVLNEPGIYSTALFNGDQLNGFEFRVDDYQVVDRTEAWLEVYLPAQETTGWIPYQSAQIAIQAGDSVRRYITGTCWAIAQNTEYDPGFGWWQHRVFFPDVVQLTENGKVAFNGRIREELDYRLEGSSTVVLPSGWVARHSGFSPIWSHTAYWTAQWKCDDDLFE